MCAATAAGSVTHGVRRYGGRFRGAALVRRCRALSTRVCAAAEPWRREYCHKHEFADSLLPPVDGCGIISPKSRGIVPLPEKLEQAK